MDHKELASRFHIGLPTVNTGRNTWVDYSYDKLSQAPQRYNFAEHA